MTIVAFGAEGPVLPSVEASVVYDDGRIERVGVTDQLGTVRISRDRLDRHARVILFCLEGYSCAALRTSGMNLLESDEQTVSLAPAVVR